MQKRGKEEWEKKAEAPKEEKGGEKKKKADGGRFTMVMKMDLHCEGCARRVKHFIKKSDGRNQPFLPPNSSSFQRFFFLFWFFSHLDFLI